MAYSNMLWLDSVAVHSPGVSISAFVRKRMGQICLRCRMKCYAVFWVLKASLIRSLLFTLFQPSSFNLHFKLYTKMSVGYRIVRHISLCLMLIFLLLSTLSNNRPGLGTLDIARLRIFNASNADGVRQVGVRIPYSSVQANLLIIWS